MSLKGELAVFDEIRFNEFEASNSHKLAKVKLFLKEIGVKISPDIELFVTAHKGLEIVGCGGLAGKTLKCIAITPSMRGQGFVLNIMTHLLKAAYKRGRNELFLFSNPKNREFFEGCGFRFIEQSANEVMLMENCNRLFECKKELQKEFKSGKKIGSIVMNANPFTLGHQYLVQEAAKSCDWLHLFVVREDASIFTFNDRLMLIKEGLKHLKNITIHKGSDYIISKATFPTYFIKDEKMVDSLYSQLDLKIFKHHIAPQLGITHRFVGNEPHCVVTNEYNKQMKKVLASKDEYGYIEVVEIKRINWQNRPISASRVRDLLKQKRIDEIKPLVPPATFEFLQRVSSPY
jgi:[citrate (pro-3S)-lyase] ligase